MPSFVYVAKKDNAETVTGQLSAADQDEAIDQINELGLLPVQIEEAQEEVVAKKVNHRAIKRKHLYYFNKQLASLLKSGMPLLNSLEVLSRQTPNASLRNVLIEVVANIRNGRSFSACLKDYPKTFSPLFVAMMKAGEESGQLREMLLCMANYQYRQEELSNKIRSAMIYPILMSMVGFGTVLFILTYVLPKIVVLFENSKTVLPWPTKIVMGIGVYAKEYWLPLIIVLAGSVLVFRIMMSIGGFKKNIHGVLYRLPLLGPFILKVEIERFLRTMSMLLNSGVPILKSLDVSIPLISSGPLQRDLELSRYGIKEGSSLGEGVLQSSSDP